MTALSLTKLYSLLAEKVGKEPAEAMATFIDAKTSSVLQESLKHLAEKEDVANLRTDLRTEMADLRTEMTEMKAELLRWMFVFWIGQIGVTFGFIYLFINK